MSDRIKIAQDAWKEIPDWLEVLIAKCDAPGSSQSKIAKKLGRTPGVISQVMRNSYKGDMADFESRVRDILCAEQIKCPALDWITTADCRRWRDEAEELGSGPLKVRMYRACRACPKFMKPTDGGDDSE